MGLQSKIKKIIEKCGDVKISTGETVGSILVDVYAMSEWKYIEDGHYPPTDKYILLTFRNFSGIIIGRYEENENGGAFYAGDESETLVSQDLYVDAWHELPLAPDKE